MSKNLDFVHHSYKDGPETHIGPIVINYRSNAYVFIRNVVYMMQNSFWVAC